jgi:hypothetical protein
MFRKKIGPGLIIVLAVALVATIVAGYLVWSMVSTSPKNPQEISLAITSDEWSAAQFYQVGHQYDISIDATFFLSPGQATDYGIIVEAVRNGNPEIYTATVQFEDFNVTATVNGVEVPVWENNASPYGQFMVGGKMYVPPGTTHEDVVITITPKAGSTDLRMISFNISAIQT